MAIAFCGLMFSNETVLNEVRCVYGGLFLLLRCFGGMRLLAMCARAQSIILHCSPGNSLTRSSPALLPPCARCCCCQFGAMLCMAVLLDTFVIRTMLSARAGTGTLQPPFLCVAVCLDSRATAHIGFVLLLPLSLSVPSVPAVLHLLGSANWWPGHFQPHRCFSPAPARILSRQTAR